MWNPVAIINPTFILLHFRGVYAMLIGSLDLASEEIRHGQYRYQLLGTQIRCWVIGQYSAGTAASAQNNPVLSEV